MYSITHFTLELGVDAGYTLVFNIPLEHLALMLMIVTRKFLILTHESLCLVDV